MIFSSLTLVFIGVSAFVVTFAGVLLAIRFFPSLGLMDRPQRYGLTRSPIPYYGGIIFAVAFFGIAPWFLPLTPPVIGVFLGLGLILVVSFLDDMFFLSPLIRLGAQVFSGLILAFSGIGIHSLPSPFGAPISLDVVPFSFPGLGSGAFFGPKVLFLVGILFTVVWVVFVMNSMNFFDGVPGLLSGVSCIASLVLFLLAIRPQNMIDQTPVVIISLIVFGMTAAFVIFDLSPPKILMGDTGSMFLGFILAVSAILAGGKVATVFIVLGFPCLDAVWSIGRRIFSGMSPLKGDLDHLHHRLLRFGLKPWQVIFLLYLFSAAFGGAALFLSTYQKFFVAGAIAVVIILVSVLLIWRAKKKPSF